MATAEANENRELMLVVLMKQGDARAFREIYDCYWEKLFAYAYNRLDSREESEEVVQDVFFALWSKRESIVITSSLSAYLFTATKHRLLNELRSVKVRKAYAAHYAAFVGDLYDNSNVEQQDLSDLRHSLETTITRLPRQCQSVFRLSREQHIPNQTIAKKLNISTKTVENYLTQALKHIRTSLGASAAHKTPTGTPTGIQHE